MNTTFENLADPEVLPRVTEVNRGHYEAAAEGLLAVRRCELCGLLFHYPRPHCPGCHSTSLTWEDLSGRGRVVVAAVVSRPPWNEMPREAPYAVALIELDEGPRMLSTVENCPPDSVRAGMTVHAGFERIGEYGLVRFAPSP